jgi:hypothetical protein
MPGSWVSTPARKCAGQCALSHADWNGRQRERRGVRLAEPERRERLEDLPDPVDDRSE